MAKKLYVGNLAYHVNVQRLQEHYSQAGTGESVQVILDRMSGRYSNIGENGHHLS